MRPRPSPPTPGPRPDRRTASVVGLAAATVAAIAIVAGVFLSIYLVRGFRIPVGDDVPTYLWRARAVASQGIDVLQRADHYPFHSNSTNPSRTGYPVTAALLQAVDGVTPWRFVFLFPSVAAVAIGLAAGAIAVECLGEPRWAFPLYTVLVGLSANVLVTSRGYFDNLLVDLVILGAIAAALLVLDGRRAGAATALFVAAAAVVHWQFALILVGLLVCLLIAAAPEALRARRAGTPLVRTPAARLAGAVGAGTVIGVSGLALLPPLGSFGTNTRGQIAVILRRQVPYYVFPVTAPLTAAGAVALAAGGDRRRRRALVVFVASAAVGLAGYVAFRLGANVPAQRLLGAALGLPMLLGAAIVWLAGLLARAGRTPGARRQAAVGARALVGAALAGVVAVGVWSWYGTKEYEFPRTHEEIGEMMGYVGRLPSGTPVVFAVTERPSGEPIATPGARAMPGGAGAGQALRRLRGQAPPDRVADVYVYLGSPENLLAGHPTLRADDRAFSEDSRRYLAVDREAMRRHAVVLVPSAFYADFETLEIAHPDWISTGAFMVVRGPPPNPATLLPPSPRHQGALGLVGATVLTLLVLAAVGAGWAASVLPASRAGRAALSPAFGAATLALGGLAADRAGLPLHGGAAVLVVAIVAAAGWAPAGWRRFRPAEGT
jgi:hypothetical protein